MKKMILLLGLFTFINCSAMNRIIGASVALSPVAIPGTYYYVKSKVENAKKGENVFKGFVGGMILGVIPGINVGFLSLHFFAYCADRWESLDRWLQDEKPQEVRIERPYEKAGRKGMLAGLALYGSIPLGLAIAATEVKKNPQAAQKIAKEMRKNGLRVRRNIQKSDEIIKR